MPIWDKIFSAGGKTLAEPIDALGNVADKLFTSKEEKLHAEFVLEKLKLHKAELQVELNKVEAQHRSIFVAGWRPFIGWIAGFSLATFFLPQFALASYLWWRMCIEANKLLPYPEVAAEYLFELTIGMLGLGLMRTYEKNKGLTK